jgi:hypothetical protein
MAKVSAHDKALEFLRSKGSATPAEIEAHVGQGAYSSKYICYLKLRGHEIETVKSGRTVTEYKYVSEGDSATRDYKWVPPAKRGAAPAAPKAAKVKVVAAPKPKKAKVVTQKAAAAKPKRQKAVMDANYDEVEKTFGSSGAIGNYSVDPDWDSMDGIDVANFLK